MLCINGFDKKICLAFSSYLDTFWKVYVHVELIQINCKCDNQNKNVTIAFVLVLKNLRKYNTFTTHVSMKALVYKDSQIQQHWIYEMKEVLPFL
jgi:hypothetical protein